MARFARFLAERRSDTARLVLLGDLFDFWVTPAQLHAPGIRPALDALRQLVAAGVDVGFAEGNRDFVATPDLRRLGVRSLPEVDVLRSGGRRIAFTHGDQLCTRDVRYQAVRRVARSRMARHIIRSVPSRMAMTVGEGARAGSKLETSRKAYGDMGLVPREVGALLRRADADALICGHVHWGQRFRLDVAGRERELVVLSAWERRGSFARVVDGRIEFRWFD